MDGSSIGAIDPRILNADMVRRLAEAGIVLSDGAKDMVFNAAEREMYEAAMCSPERPSMAEATLPKLPTYLAPSPEEIRKLTEGMTSFKLSAETVSKLGGERALEKFPTQKLLEAYAAQEQEKKMTYNGIPNQAEVEKFSRAFDAAMARKYAVPSLEHLAKIGAMPTAQLKKALGMSPAETAHFQEWLSGDGQQQGAAMADEVASTGRLLRDIAHKLMRITKNNAFTEAMQTEGTPTARAYASALKIDLELGKKLVAARADDAAKREPLAKEPKDKAVEAGNRWR